MNAVLLAILLGVPGSGPVTYDLDSGTPTRIYLKRGTTIAFTGSLPKSLHQFTVTLFRGQIVEETGKFDNAWELKWDSSRERFNLCTLIVTVQDLMKKVIGRARMPVTLYDRPPFSVEVEKGTESAERLMFHVKGNPDIPTNRFEALIDGKPIDAGIDAKGNGSTDGLSLQPGERKLQVICHPTDGGEILTDPVTVTIPPRIQILSAEVKDASSLDKQPVAELKLKTLLSPDKIELEIGGKSLPVPASPPFESIRAPLPDLPAGNHPIRAVAVLSDGRRVESAEVTISLDSPIVYSKCGPPRIKQLRDKWEPIRHPFSGSFYAVSPISGPPYRPGSLNPLYVADGLAFLNFVRYAAGLPDDLTAEDNLNHEAQAASAVLAANGSLSHRPPPPAGMDPKTYQEGAKAAAGSNIGQYAKSIRDALLGYMDDSDEINIKTLGHRRWLLNPPMQRTGFGFVGKGKYGFTATIRADKSRTEPVSYDFIAWPAAGAFPIELFGPKQAWSISLNPALFRPPDPAAVAVQLRRITDNASWHFDVKEDNTTRYFNIENTGYGIPNCIMFRPGSLGALRDGDRFEVNITGLQKTDGSRATLEYSVRFFSLDK